MSERVVRTIPATVNRFTATPINSRTKRKVAAYARVSTDTEEQLTSYEAQVDYYTSYIKSRDDWEFVNVYTDEGITGTSTKHREGFKQMVRDALDGKIDLIITKSVSRFARNTVDSLTTIRRLKENGTECYFEKENIWTFDGKGELLLTIMSSIAQEEARSISENCTWGQRKRFADGKVSIPFKSVLGYDRGEDGNLVINQEQAKLVRRIYGMFLQGQSAYAIARKLTEENIPTPAGKATWYASTVKSILTNEKYKGDALLQKTYTSDFLTKKKKINKGEVQQYYVKNNHEAIIEPEIFDMVQKLMGQTKSGKNRKSSVSIFSSKIRCGECGSYYGSKVWHSNDKYRRIIWQCNHKFDNEKKCSTPHLDEEKIKQVFVSAMNKLITSKEQLLSDFEIIKEELFSAAELEADKLARKETMELFMKNLKKQSGAVTEFDDDLWLSMVDYVTVNSKEDIRVTFKNGITVKV
ncbi:MAG: recombinase family protein [Candidatus Ornithomonoglobus sp.]